MRILHVTEAPGGGVANYLNYIVPSQQRRYGSDAIRIVGPKSHIDQLDEPRIVIPYARTGRNLSSLKALADCVQGAIIEFKPTHIHAHSFFAGLALRIAVNKHALSGAATIYCAHGWAFLRKVSAIERLLCKVVEVLLQARADRIICISQDEYREAAKAGIAPERMVCLPNCIPDQPPSTCPARGPDTKLKVVFVGRFDRQKGLDVLLEAAKHLKPSVEIVAAGAAFVDRAAAIKPPSNVKLVGWLKPDQVQQLIQDSDLVVVPSRWEGFGLVALEAMRAGKAVIASRVGGLPELIDDNVTGVLVPADDAHRLAEAINAIDRQRAACMGKCAREKFEKSYSLDAYMERLHLLYTSLASRSVLTRRAFTRTPPLRQRPIRSSQSRARYRL